MGVSEGSGGRPFGGGHQASSAVSARQTGITRESSAIALKARTCVLEVEPVSLSARIQAGETGPGLEEQLAEPGLDGFATSRVGQFSTLGALDRGPARGHSRRYYTQIDDLVEAVRALTPDGQGVAAVPGSETAVSPEVGCCSARRARWA